MSLEWNSDRLTTIEVGEIVLESWRQSAQLHGEDMVAFNTILNIAHEETTCRFSLVFYSGTLN